MMDIHIIYVCLLTFTTELGSTVQISIPFSHAIAISEADNGRQATQDTFFCNLLFNTGTSLESVLYILTLSSDVATASFV